MLYGETTYWIFIAYQIRDEMSCAYLFGHHMWHLIKIGWIHYISLALVIVHWHMNLFHCRCKTIQSWMLYTAISIETWSMHSWHWLLYTIIKIKVCMMNININNVTCLLSLWIATPTWEFMSHKIIIRSIQCICKLYPMPVIVILQCITLVWYHVWEHLLNLLVASFGRAYHDDNSNKHKYSRTNAISPLALRNGNDEHNMIYQLSNWVGQKNSVARYSRSNVP